MDTAHKGYLNVAKAGHIFCIKSRLQGCSDVRSSGILRSGIIQKLNLIFIGSQSWLAQLTAHVCDKCLLLTGELKHVNQFQHWTTKCYMFVLYQYSCYVKTNKKLSYRRDNARRQLLHHSRSLKVTDVSTNRKHICDFLLVNNTD